VSGVMTFPAQVEGSGGLSLPDRPLHLALGMFDGVHVGHRAVVGGAVEGARSCGGISGVLTFHPHPSVLFRPADPTRLILSPELKGERLLELGVDVVITERFTSDLAAVAAEDFVPWLRRRLPRLAALHVGENFRFGAGRRGDVAALAASGRRCGVAVVSAPRVMREGAPVSSTRIRGLLTDGEMGAANRLLGYAYFARGAIAPGKQLGRTIGFPTLNLEWAPDLRPRLGVYAVRVSGPRAPEGLPAVANFGLRPTVEQALAPRLEVHVLGPCPFGTGDAVKVEWLSFLRPERKFADLAALREQIGRDRAGAERFFTVPGT